MRLIGPARSRIPAALLLLFVAVLCVALAIHVAPAADHGMSMLGTCLAVFVAIVLTFWTPSFSSRRPDGTGGFVIRLPTFAASPARGRYPPDEGTVLRR